MTNRPSMVEDLGGMSCSSVSGSSNGKKMFLYEGKTMHVLNHGKRLIQHICKIIRNRRNTSCN